MIDISAKHFKLLSKKGVIFRFLSVYLVLFVCLDLIARAELFFRLPFKPIREIISWFGLNFVDNSYQQYFIANGLTDTLYHYIVLIILMIISILGVVIWILIDSRLKNFESIVYGISVILRFYIAIILINYGFVKVFSIQFPEPSLNRLVDTYGNSTPMGLAWSFLGFSKGYNIVMGIAEMMSVFILFRRTLTFGLIIALGLSLNILAVNIFYDIPLKILSSHLTLIILFLLSRDVKQIIVFLFGNKKVTLIRPTQPECFDRIYSRRLIVIAKIALLIVVFSLAFYKSSKRSELINGQFTKSEFYGIYQVNSLEKNGIKVADDSSFDNQLKYIIMEYQGLVEMIDCNKNSRTYTSYIDTVSNTIKLYPLNNSNDSLLLRFKKLRDKSYTFNYTILQDTMVAKCIRLSKSDMILTSHGIHFINESLPLTEN